VKGSKTGKLGIRKKSAKELTSTRKLRHGNILPFVQASASVILAKDFVQECAEEGFVK